MQSKTESSVARTILVYIASLSAIIVVMLLAYAFMFGLGSYETRITLANLTTGAGCVAGISMLMLALRRMSLRIVSVWGRVWRSAVYTASMTAVLYYFGAFANQIFRVWCVGFWGEQQGCFSDLMGWSIFIIPAFALSILPWIFIYWIIWGAIDLHKRLNRGHIESKDSQTPRERF